MVFRLQFDIRNQKRKEKIRDISQHFVDLLSLMESSEDIQLLQNLRKKEGEFSQHIRHISFSDIDLKNLVNYYY